MEVNILVVDDDKEILKLIEIYLMNEGYKVYNAINGEEALNMVNREEIHLIVLDIMMPKLSGIEVCKIVREKFNIPILMLSAKSEDMDKIEGLMTGADDYLTKPFNPLELIVRIKALLRRSYYFDKSVNKDKNIIEIGEILINKTTHIVSANNNEINLTSTEFDILYLLASNVGRVFSAEEIFERVWKEKYYQSNNTVMVHVSRIREKLEQNMNGGKIIYTVWGVGYKIE